MPWSRVELWNPRISRSCHVSGASPRWSLKRSSTDSLCYQSGASFFIPPSLKSFSLVSSPFSCADGLSLSCCVSVFVSSFKIFFYESSAIRGLHRYHASPLLFTRSRSDTLLAAGTTDWHHITAESWVSLLSHVCMPSILCIYTKLHLETGEFSLIPWADFFHLIQDKNKFLYLTEISL